jgi:hypothetical protein
MHACVCVSNVCVNTHVYIESDVRIVDRL